MSVALQYISRTIGRSTARLVLDRLVRWRPLEHPEDGYSIVLGVPWDLRHLLPVNLRFLSATDTSSLHEVFIVFDRRPRPGAEALLASIARDFPNLPQTVLWYPPSSGTIVERLNISTFYNSLNTVLALSRCRTRYAVLHDFDLFPLRRDHFTSIVDTMIAQKWQFSGHEWTFFEGLTVEDRQIGTWTLGIDVEYVRARFRPIQCFHTFYRVRGRRISIDPYAWIQFRTPKRGLVTDHCTERFCHVQNLCSTYLRFLKGGWLKVAWRLHYLWYLESIAGHIDRLIAVVDAMEQCVDGVLHVDRRPADFTTTHAACANVLRRELHAMEFFLFGTVRPEVAEYIDSFERFIHRVGDVTVLHDVNGCVKWTPRFDRQGNEIEMVPTERTSVH